MPGLSFLERWLPRLGILIALVSLLSTGCSPKGNGIVAAQGDDGAATELNPQRDIVSASGSVVPARRATLSHPVGGQVAELLVKAGDQVEAGQALLRLEAGQLQAAVDLARANLAEAEAALDELRSGPRAEELRGAEAEVAGATAGLGQAQAGLTTAEAAYQGALQAQKDVERQLAIAQADVELARAELARVQAGPGPEEIAAAKAVMEKADAVRALAQSEYDKIAYSAAAGASPQAAALQQATADFEAAQATYQGLLAQPRPVDVAVAQAALNRAVAYYDAAAGAVEATQPTVDQAAGRRDAARAGVEAAQATVDAAQARLDLLKAGATAGQIASAEARVSAAEAALAQAETALMQATLVAPFEGTIGELLVREGETILPGSPLIELGDLTQMQVETTDFNEIDLYRLEVGSRVQVTFDALPTRQMGGVVTEIAPKATRGQAGTNYTVVVEFEEEEPLLRWGMTAFIDTVVE